MKISKFVGYIFTPLFILCFVGTLLIFHPLLVIANRIFGYRAHKVVLEEMNVAILYCLRLIGTRFKISYPYKLPTDRPIIVVSNHQSMYDIPLLLTTLKRNHPKFVAKVELSRRIPSISYALRNMGSVLIDRSDQKQSLAAIEEFGKYIAVNNYAACIFPEGTRARDGNIKKFKMGGLITLLRTIPNALVVPVVIDGPWKILQYKFWPVPFGTKVNLRILKPIEANSMAEKDLCSEVEKIINEELKSLREQVSGNGQIPEIKI